MKNIFERFQSFFGNTAEKIAENPAPLSHFISLFGAILAVRLTLEFYSNHKLFTHWDVLHIGLWFVFIVLAFLLQLHFFSGQPIGSISRLVITCFSISLSAPLIDLLVNMGMPAKMNYLFINNWKDVLWSYVTIGGTSLTRGATLGIRVEIALLVVACFNYVQMKRRSWLWGITAAWSVYTVLFMSGAIPFILQRINASLGLVHTPDDQSTLLLLVVLDAALLALIFWRFVPASTFKTLIPPLSLLFLQLSLFGVGTSLGLGLYPDNWQLTPTTLWHFPMLLFLHFGLWLYLGKRATISPALHKGLFLILMAWAWAVSFHLLFVLCLVWALDFLKHTHILPVASSPLLEVLTEGMIWLSFCMMGFLWAGGPMIGFPNHYLLGISCYLASWGLLSRYPSAMWATLLYLFSIIGVATYLVETDLLRLLLVVLGLAWLVLRHYGRLSATWLPPLSLCLILLADISAQ